MIQVPLTRGLFALIDAEDLSIVAPHKWQAVECGGRYYARRGMPLGTDGPTTQYMHTLLTGWSYVDHANGFGLDNRRANLREASHSQNNQNQFKRRGRTSSKYKGVSLFRRTGRWKACITVDRRTRHIGYYATKEEAARAYDAAAIRHYGKFARVNFPAYDHKEQS